ncbi:CzcE family metal-binding protein [Noviherbaspirillum sp.]|uniref:CzcE family metal-binding protein n=1 Tax=Noviherbaspirillum sp. TaxID=1926288 RepID=UPI002FE32B66
MNLFSHFPLFAATLALIGCATRAPVELYGEPAPPSAAQRTIVIGPDTRHVNVEGGEIIRFVAGGKEFGWSFNNALSINSFSLNAVAPPGLLSQPVHAYVSRDPRYIGGGDGPER